MDAAEEMDDRCTASRVLGATMAEEHVGYKHPHAWAVVGFNQEEYRLARLRGLLDAQW